MTIKRKLMISLGLLVIVSSTSWALTAVGVVSANYASQTIARTLWKAAKYAPLRNKYLLDFNAGASHQSQSDFSVANKLYASSSSTKNEDLLCKATYNWGRSLQSMGQLSEDDNDIPGAITLYNNALQKASRQRCHGLDKHKDNFLVLQKELEDKLAELKSKDQDKQNSSQDEQKTDEQTQKEITDKINDTSQEVIQVQGSTNSDRTQEPSSESYETIL